MNLLGKTQKDLLIFDKLKIRNLGISFLFLSTLISACSESSPQNPSEAVSETSQVENLDTEKALALVAAGCTGGYLDSLSYEGVEYITPEHWRGSVFKFYALSNGIDIYDLNATGEDKDRNSVIQIAIWHSDFAEQSFVSAKTLDTK